MDDPEVIPNSAGVPVNQENMTPISSSKRTVVLGIVNTSGMKCTNVNRKRRWDQPPNEVSDTPCIKKVHLSETNDSEIESPDNSLCVNTSPHRHNEVNSDLLNQIDVILPGTEDTTEKLVTDRSTLFSEMPSQKFCDRLSPCADGGYSDASPFSEQSRSASTVTNVIVSGGSDSVCERTVNSSTSVSQIPLEIGKIDSQKQKADETGNFKNSITVISHESDELRRIMSSYDESSSDSNGSNSNLVSNSINNHEKKFTVETDVCEEVLSDKSVSGEVSVPSNQINIQELENETSIKTGEFSDNTLKNQLETNAFSVKTLVPTKVGTRDMVQLESQTNIPTSPEKLCAVTNSLKEFSLPLSNFSDCMTENEKLSRDQDIIHSGSFMEYPDSLSEPSLFNNSVDVVETESLIVKKECSILVESQSSAGDKADNEQEIVTSHNEPSTVMESTCNLSVQNLSNVDMSRKGMDSSETTSSLECKTSQSIAVCPKNVNKSNDLPDKILFQEPLVESNESQIVVNDVTFQNNKSAIDENIDYIQTDSASRTSDVLEQSMLGDKVLKHPCSKINFETNKSLECQSNVFKTVDSPDKSDIIEKSTIQDSEMNIIETLDSAFSDEVKKDDNNTGETLTSIPSISTDNETCDSQGMLNVLDGETTCVEQAKSLESVALNNNILSLDAIKSPENLISSLQQSDSPHALTIVAKNVEEVGEGSSMSNDVQVINDNNFGSSPPELDDSQSSGDQVTSDDSFSKQNLETNGQQFQINCPTIVETEIGVLSTNSIDPEVMQVIFGSSCNKPQVNNMIENESALDSVSTTESNINLPPDKKNDSSENSLNDLAEEGFIFKDSKVELGHVTEKSLSKSFSGSSVECISETNIESKQIESASNNEVVEADNTSCRLLAGHSPPTDDMSESPSTLPEDKKLEVVTENEAVLVTIERASPISAQVEENQDEDDIIVSESAEELNNIPGSNQSQSPESTDIKIVDEIVMPTEILVSEVTDDFDDKSPDNSNILSENTDEVVSLSIIESKVDEITSLTPVESAGNISSENTDEAVSLSIIESKVDDITSLTSEENSDNISSANTDEAVSLSIIESKVGEITSITSVENTDNISSENTDEAVSLSIIESKVGKITSLTSIENTDNILAENTDEAVSLSIIESKVDEITSRTSNENVDNILSENTDEVVSVSIIESKVDEITSLTSKENTDNILSENNDEVLSLSTIESKVDEITNLTSIENTDNILSENTDEVVSLSFVESKVGEMISPTSIERVDIINPAGNITSSNEVMEYENSIGLDVEQQNTPVISCEFSELNQEECSSESAVLRDTSIYNRSDETQSSTSDIKTKISEQSAFMSGAVSQNVPDTEVSISLSQSIQNNDDSIVNTSVPLLMPSESVEIDESKDFGEPVNVHELELITVETNLEPDESSIVSVDNEVLIDDSKLSINESTSKLDELDSEVILDTMESNISVEIDKDITDDIESYDIVEEVVTCGSPLSDNILENDLEEVDDDDQNITRSPPSLASEETLETVHESLGNSDHIEAVIENDTSDLRESEIDNQNEVFIESEVFVDGVSFSSEMLRTGTKSFEKDESLSVLCNEFTSRKRDISAVNSITSPNSTIINNEIDTDESSDLPPESKKRCIETSDNSSISAVINDRKVLKDVDSSNIPLLKTVSSPVLQKNDPIKLKNEAALHSDMYTQSGNRAILEQKHEPITLRIYKDNLSVKTDDLDSPKRNKSSLFSSEIRHQQASPSKSSDILIDSTLPQAKQLEFTLKIAKDVTTNKTKATMSPKSNMSPSSSWKLDSGSLSPSSPGDPGGLKLKLTKPSSPSLPKDSRTHDKSNDVISHLSPNLPQQPLAIGSVLKKIIESETPEPKTEVSILEQALINKSPMPNSLVKKRGRPRKIVMPSFDQDGNPLNHSLPTTPLSSSPLDTSGDSEQGSNRQVRSCRARTQPIVVKTRKPRGGGVGRGGGRGGARGVARPITSDKEAEKIQEKLSDHEKAELAKIEARKEKMRLDRIARNEAKKAKKLARKLKDEERRKRQLAEKAEKAAAAAPQVFEEETRMSAPGSRGHTPAPAALLSRLNQTSETQEESQSSVPNSGNKKGRMEIPIDPESDEVRVDQLAEYQWQGSELCMIQEQVSLYLGVKSFKRKYPDLKRRTVEAEERTFLEDSGLVPKSMCDLGLTAVSSAEILDIMFHDFHEKYEEFRGYMREKESREFSFKQKALSAKSTDKSKGEPRELALEAAAVWNHNINRDRREERRCALDLQTFTVHYPKSAREKMQRPALKPGLYPVPVIPGQFSDYYKTYTPTELMYFPLNTVMYGPLKPNERRPNHSDGSDSSSSSSDDSSCSSSTSDSEDEDSASKECKICNGEKKAASETHPEILLQCSQCKGLCHPTCQEITPEMLPHIKKYSWHCSNCKTCVHCKNGAKDEKMLFCDLCDRGYHMNCVGLKMSPEGRWHCSVCSFCTICGSKDPGGTEWHYEYKKTDKGVRLYQRTLCVPCSKIALL